LNDVFNKDINLGTYVFGDILTVGNQEIWGLIAIFIITIFYVIFAFRKILLININSDLAKIDGIKIQFWNLSFLILLAITIALSVRIVGILLMTALLVLPAAIARIFALSAKQMLILSLIIGLFNAILSFKIADNYNLAVGSSVIATFCVIFIFSLFLKKITTR
jgi:zinc transport system permease protein